MDWQTKIGIGMAVVFFFMLYAVKDMPHWITFPGIIIGLTLIAWSMLSKRFFIGPPLLFISGMALMAAAVGWYWDIPELKHDANVKDIAENTEYSGLSNTQLKNLVIATTAEIRKVEADYKNQRSEIVQFEMPNPNRTTAEMDKANLERNKKLALAYDNEVASFQSRFLSKSRSLHYELLKRLHLEYPKLPEKFDPKEMTKVNATALLDTGFVAGAQPLYDLSSYLEDLANKLP